jgi:hypothetical protein
MATSCTPVTNTWLPAAAAHAHVFATILLKSIALFVCATHTAILHSHILAACETHFAACGCCMCSHDCNDCTALQELLSLEVVELRRELEGLEAELAAAQQDVAHASNRVSGDAGGNLMYCMDSSRQRPAAQNKPAAAYASSSSTWGMWWRVKLQCKSATSSNTICWIAVHALTQQLCAWHVVCLQFHGQVPGRMVKGTEWPLYWNVRAAECVTASIPCMVMSASAQSQCCCRCCCCSGPGGV